MKMPFEIQITPGGASPIFRQIVDQVRLAAATGRLMAGDQLPSVRALAERLLVNPNTIAKAYGELSREGIIESQQGRGASVLGIMRFPRRIEPDQKPEQLYGEPDQALGEIPGRFG